MAIEALLEIPKVERDDAVGGYAYPEEYRNKLFIHDDQYVYLKISSYESFSKTLLDTIIAETISNSTESEYQMSDEMLKSIIEETVNKKFNDIQPSNSMTEIETMINDLFSNKYDILIDGISSRFEEFDEQFKNQFEECVKKETYERDKINQGSSSGISISQINSIVENCVSQHIEELHRGLKPIVGNLLKQMVPNDINSSSKISIGTLMALKEAGYSVQEIRDLRQEGLI